MDKIRVKAAVPRWRSPKALGLYGAATLAGLCLLGFTMRPAGLRVDRNSLSFGDVRQGDMVVTVQGNGLLVATQLRFVAAQVEGRVEQVLVKAGAAVEAGAVMVQLSNPLLNQQAEETRWALEAMEAEFNALKVNLDSELLNQQATVTKARFAYESAKLQFDAQAQLVHSHVVSQLDFQKSELNVRQLSETLVIEQSRLQKFGENLKAQGLAKQAQVNKLRKTLQRAEEQVAALTVRAPMSGIVQDSPLQPGQRVLVGANIAKVARPDELYAELQVQEAQARDLALGQEADIDTRNGVIAGVVTRIDPAVTKGVVKVDVKLKGDLPKGARPDLSIEGKIRVAELHNVLHVQRPAFAQNQQLTSVFRVQANGSGDRLPVQFGLASVNEIEIKSGLSAGDRIVVSDTSNWSQQDHVQLN